MTKSLYMSSTDALKKGIFHLWLVESEATEPIDSRGQF